MTDKKVSVLVAPWGNYRQWKPATYRVDSTVVENANTSLAVLMAQLAPVHTIVVIPDTLPPSTVYPSTYSRLVETLKQDVLQFLSVQGIDTSYVEVLVSPMVGTFQNGRFHGEFSDFYYYTLHQVAKFFGELDTNPGTPIEIYFDSTHGLNYMTMALYGIIRELAGILATKWKVNFIAYCSDPFPFAQDVGSTTLKVNEVERIRIVPTIPPLVGFCKKLSIFLQAARLGLPLLFVESFPSPKKLDQKMETLLNQYAKGIHYIPNSSHSAELTRVAKLDERLHICAISWLVATIHKKANVLANYHLAQSGIPIEELKSRYWGSLFSQFKHVVGREIGFFVGSLWKIRESLKTGKWHQMPNVSVIHQSNSLSSPIEKYDNGPLLRLARNLVAHSGFVHKVVEYYVSTELSHGTSRKEFSRLLYLRYGSLYREYMVSALSKSFDDVSWHVSSCSFDCFKWGD